LEVFRIYFSVCIYAGRGDLLLEKHRTQQSEERKKLGKHRKKCLSDPQKYIGIVIDGMDKKKTRLPHWYKVPKSADESCLLQMHVVGCLVYHGEIFSRVYLNYPTLRNDSNLIITILQRIWEEWRNKPCGLPPKFYFQLDNTCRENKNNLLFTYLHMLLKKKVFQKIKVGFLLVGHTHDNIDQMFSRFSTRLSKSRAFVYKDLCQVIQESYKPQPEITLLNETFDFRRFAFSEPSIVISQLRNHTFSHQFKIAFSQEEDLVPTMWAKKFSTSTIWTPEEGVKMLKDEFQEKEMWAAEIMPLLKKGERMQSSLEHIQKALADVEKGILNPELRTLFGPEVVQWWETFFQEQRDQNEFWMVQDRRLKYAFVWPGSEIYGAAPRVEEIETEGINETEIDLRVYGESREIYVGPFRNQRAIELEKENMDGDFSDLQVNSYIAVPSNHCENKRKFWVAKVEKILSRDENQVPKLIRVLWHAVKKGQDPWKGKYAPEVLGFEKHKGKKGKGAQKPIWSVQDLDISDTVVLSYNFSLSKSGTMYKKTIDRVQLRLNEYLTEKKLQKQAARLARQVDNNLPEISSSSSEESIARELS
jgi:hypothetical protein